MGWTALGDQDWEELPPELATMLGRTSPGVLAEMGGHDAELAWFPVAT